MDAELVPYEIVQRFLRARQYENVSVADFEEGAVDGVSVYSLVSYFLRGPLKIQAFTLALRRYVHDVTLNENNATSLLYIAAILADSQDDDLASKCHNIMKELQESTFIERFDLREVLKELEYQGFQPEWLRGFLLKKAKRSVSTTAPLRKI